MGNDKIKIKMMSKAVIFRVFDSFETSSRGPGCPLKARNRTSMAMSQNPSRNSNAIERAESAIPALFPARHFATCPPSSMPTGRRLSIVTIMPTHPAKLNWVHEKKLT